MNFDEALERMAERKAAALGLAETQEEVFAADGPAYLRRLCATTGVDANDLRETARAFTAHSLEALLNGAPLVSVLEGFFADALMTGHLVGSAES